MRFVLWLGLALFFVSLGYIGSDFLTELADRTEARQVEVRTDRDRVMRVLKAHERYAFYQVVINPAPGTKEIEFRGRARRDDISQSAYGTVRATCTPPSDALDCWELTTLYIDGVLVDSQPGEPVSGAVASPEDPPAPGTSSGAVSIQPQPPTGPREAGPEPSAVLPADPPAAPQPEIQPEILRPTHVVRPSRVNARRSPQGAVETTLQGGTPLVLLQRDGGWGLFRVLEGTRSGLEIWVAFSVLDAV